MLRKIGQCWFDDRIKSWQVLLHVILDKFCTLQMHHSSRCLIVTPFKGFQKIKLVYKCLDTIVNARWYFERL